MNAMNARLCSGEVTDRLEAIELRTKACQLELDECRDKGTGVPDWEDCLVHEIEVCRRLAATIRQGRSDGEYMALAVIRATEIGVAAELAEALLDRNFEGLTLEEEHDAASSVGCSEDSRICQDGQEIQEAKESQ